MGQSFWTIDRKEAKRARQQWRHGKRDIGEAGTEKQMPPSSDLTDIIKRDGDIPRKEPQAII